MSGSQYFAAEPSAGSAPRRLRLTLPDVALELVSDRGVFAHQGIDPGTKLLLLEGPAVPPGGDLLDLGCGYGPVACTLARRAPGATVWAVDVNRRALELCAANARANGLGNVRVCLPDEVPAGQEFDAIWSNPPIRIGKAALHDLLARWLARLRPGGWAALVIQRHLGADSLAAWLAGQGWRVSRLASRQGYRVLEVRRP